MEDIIRKEDALIKLYDIKADITAKKTPVNYATILEIIRQIRELPSVESNGPIYTITMLETCGTDENGHYYRGTKRVIGYFNNWEGADIAVKTNLCDRIFDSDYEFAVIEEIKEGVIQPSKASWWYKLNDDTLQYEPVDKPEIVKLVQGFAMS